LKKLRYLRAFEWSGETFKERVGEPDSLEAAVGKIVMNFADLEEVADRELRYLEELWLGHPVVDSATITFNQKIQRIGISVSKLKDILLFNRGSAPADELFGELKHNCIQADALYRQVMTARWGRRYDNGAIEVQAKDHLSGEEGDSLTGALTADQLLDVADFIGLAEWDLEEFFIEPEVFTPEAA
jgi:hypothetical protein